MIMLMFKRERSIGAALAAALASMAAPAEAKPVIYRCEDKSELAVDYTPRLAQVRAGAKQWTLARVRDSEVARYVDARAGASLVSQKREAVWTVGTRELRCKFEVMRPAE
jgi:Membrane-bound lysozyme-inhibitor of c-type lysozyme